jgi:hypothetical protein
MKKKKFTMCGLLDSSAGKGNYIHVLLLDDGFIHVKKKCKRAASPASPSFIVE